MGTRARYAALHDATVLAGAVPGNGVSLRDVGLPPAIATRSPVPPGVGNKVTLAEVPFVRLREGLDPKLMEGTASFSAVVADAQRALPPLALELDPAGCMVTAGGESFRMKASLCAWYWLLAERAPSRKIRRALHR